MKRMILIGLVGLLVFSGCAAPRNNTEKGATLGAVGGAVAGAVLGSAIGGGDPGSVLSLHTGDTLRSTNNRKGDAI